MLNAVISCIKYTEYQWGGVWVLSRTFSSNPINYSEPGKIGSQHLQSGHFLFPDGGLTGHYDFAAKF